MSFRTLVSVAVLALLLPLSPASASRSIEPQILALISTGGAQPLTCDGDECVAEFSAFCMEPGRPGPNHNAPYRMAKNSALELIARSADGTERRLPLKTARFVSQRGYSAVRISLPRSLLDDLGADSLAIQVGAGVVLLPEELPSYDQLHRQSQITAALGPNRIIGEQLVDRGGERADGARLLSYLINALPATGGVEAARRQALWSATRAAPAEVRQAGRAIARRGFERCLKERASGDDFTMRQCLQHRHDRNMWLLNQIYWQTVGPQS